MTLVQRYSLSLAMPSRTLPYLDYVSATLLSASDICTSQIHPFPTVHRMIQMTIEYNAIENMKESD